MRLRIWTIAAIVGLTGVGVGVWQLAAQTNDRGLPAPKGTVAYSRPGDTPRAADGHEPPAVASPTATPDLSRSVAPEQARSQLSHVAKVKAVLDAADSGNVEVLLALVDWQPQPCGSARGATDSCPSGVSAGTELPMVNVSDSEPFWVRADTLRSMLSEVLNGDPLTIGYASTTETAPELASRRAAGEIYRIGIEGGPRSTSSWGALTTLTGVFLVLDSGLDRPILALSPLTSEWSAVQQGGNGASGYVGQRIIVFGTR